jgi:flagella basal body P-ring formation protein FlgA
MKLLGITLGILCTGLLIAGTSIANPCDEAVVEKIFHLYQLDKSSYEVEVLSNPLKSAEVSADEIVIRPLSQKEPLGLFTVIAKVVQNGKAVEEGQVRLRIKKYADVLVTTDRIKRHEDLIADKLVVKRMDVTNLVERPLVSLDELAGHRAKRNISKGKILTAGAVEPIPDVERGHEVIIVYTNGLCRVTAEGITLQSGMAGDYVKVKNKSSGKIIIARVIDETAVAVDP